MGLLNEFKDSLIFEIQKEFWNERGKGARYRLTMTGVECMKKALSNPADVAEIIDVFKKEGFCSDIQMIEDEFSVTMNVKDCAFTGVRDGFMDHGQQPLSCALANTIMNAMEIKSGMAPELLPIGRNGSECVVGMAKMASSDVLKR
jgi:ribosomal protein S8